MCNLSNKKLNFKQSYELKNIFIIPLISGTVMPTIGIFDIVPIYKTKKIGQPLQLNMLETSKLSSINNLHFAMGNSVSQFLYYGGDEQAELV